VMIPRSYSLSSQPTEFKKAHRKRASPKMTQLVIAKAFIWDGEH